MRIRDLHANIVESRSLTYGYTTEINGRKSVDVKWKEYHNG